MARFIHIQYEFIWKKKKNLDFIHTTLSIKWTIFVWFSVFTWLKWKLNTILDFELVFSADSRSDSEKKSAF